jgi:conjugative transfer region protein TrbK
MKHICVQQLARPAAMVFAIAASGAAIIYGGPNDDGGVIAPLERKQADALADELARCRTITSNETSALEACRRIWADNRRQFFAPAEPRRTSSPTSSAAPLEIPERAMPARAEQQQSETR